MNSTWIGVDLDGCLAIYAGWQSIDDIGEPIMSMINLVKKFLLEGKTVKIFTARMHGHGLPLLDGTKADVVTPIQNWCLKHIGQKLEVTNVKDFAMEVLYDDRCVTVEANTGRILTKL